MELVVALAALGLADQAVVARPPQRPWVSELVGSEDQVAADRGDVARAYQRLEQAYAAFPPKDLALQRRIHSSFDRLPWAILGGGLSGGVAYLHELAFRLQPSTSTAERLAMALKLRPQPTVAALINPPEVLGVELAQIYPPRVTPAKSVSRPSMSRPGMSRPGMSQPSMSRPGMSRPGTSQPGVSQVGGGKAETDKAEWHGPQGSIDHKPRASNHQLTLVLVDPAGRRVRSRHLQPRDWQDGSALVRFDLAGHRLREGTYRLVLEERSGQEIASFPWPVADRPLDVIRKSNQKILQRLRRAAPTELQDAIQSCWHRNRMLRDQPQYTASPVLLADLPTLSREVRREVQTLASGRNPYAQRVGEYWRCLVVPRSTIEERSQDDLGLAQNAPETIDTGTSDTGTSDTGRAKSAWADIGTKGSQRHRSSSCIPLRVFAPKSAAQGRPLPLLIAFHGAGADENIFLAGHANGQLRQLAAEHDLLVACPSTYAILNNPALLEPMLESLSRDYRLDRSRIYVMGHSLGAITSMELAVRSPHRFAAVVCVAGAVALTAETTLPPTRVYAAQMDLTVPAASIEGMIAPARAANRVQYRKIPDQGHILLINTVLPEAVRWLVSQRSPLPANPAQSEQQR